MNYFLHFNRAVRPATEAIVTASNRGLRYGDGLFETIKMVNGQMPLFSLHTDRLFQGLNTLQMQLPGDHSPGYLQQSILELCEKNQVTGAARIRLTVFRGNGNLYSAEDAYASILIQAEPLPEAYLALNPAGWQTDIYPEVKKSSDLLSNLKSNNYLPYIMAALHAQRYCLNDCLVLNTHNRICDATMANIFWIHNRRICTPPLSEGGVAGVMRRYLLRQLNQAGYATMETPCTENELLQADEVFLTNALYGIRWVQQFRAATYSGRVTAELYERFIKNTASL